MTEYKIIYELSRRVKMVKITAASPLQALKEFKKMMPELVYKNLLLHDIEVGDEVSEIEQQTCFPCHSELFSRFSAA